MHDEVQILLHMTHNSLDRIINHSNIVKSVLLIRYVYSEVSMLLIWSFFGTSRVAYLLLLSQEHVILFGSQHLAGN
jgi:hypothetical protein